MKKLLILVIFVVLSSSCKQSPSVTMKSGIWRGEMEVQDGHRLPFNFRLEKGEGGYRMEVYNADEVLVIDEITTEGDSLLIQMPVFDGYVSGTFAEQSMKGEFIKEDLERRVPFHAVYGDAERFRSSGPAGANVSGIWETYFSKGSADEYAAKGIFSQEGDKLVGTFRTTTGDYRYLEGTVQGDSLKLSTFDGAHVFLFLAKVTDSTLSGVFYSGNHFKEPFVAQRNASFELPSEDSLTFLKEGYEEIAFSFPNSDGQMVSPQDPEYQDKVVIVQIMGTWCPNCLDETKFLVEYLENNPAEDLQVIALAFEYAKTEEGAFKGIERLKSRLNIPYPILLAQYGTSDKDAANEKLPMLNHVLSYPTTLFIDKKGEVRRIHTGFNGPATGEKYTVFKKDFHDFIQELLSE